MSDQQKPAIVVGVDGSTRSIEATRWAAAEAHRRGLRLELVHAQYEPYDPEAPTDREASDAALLEAYTAATETAPLVDVTTTAPRMAPIKELLLRSRDAAMLVLGTQTGNSVSGAIFGSIAQTVAAHAACPVTIIGGLVSSELEHGPVVVGVSPHSGGLEALRFAFDEAKLRGADLVAIRSWGDVDWATGRLGYNSELFSEWRRMEHNVLNDCLAKVENDYPQVTVHRELKGARAQVALEEASEKAQLLVVGTHRRDDHWFSRLGPVPSWLLHRSACPLMIIGRPHPLTEAIVPAHQAAVATP